MIECSRENFWYKKKRKRKSIKLRFFIFILVFTGIFLYYRYFITDTVSKICVDYTYSYSTESVNKAVLISLSDKLNYENVIKIDKNVNGEIVLMSVNSYEINKINRQIIENTKINLNVKLNGGIPVPIMAFSGIKFIAGYGKTINYNSFSIANVNSQFISKFESVGINQTLHSIYVDVTCNVNIHFPLYVKSNSFTTSVLLCEAVLVGKVPEVYLNGGLFS